MGRYAKSTIRQDFPDLSEDDDLIFVIIRNPRTLPIDQLTPDTQVEVGADGQPVDMGAGKAATFGIIAGLVTHWHVYDGTIDEDDAPPLPLPATADHIAALPFEIQNWLIKQIGDVLSTPR